MRSSIYYEKRADIHVVIAILFVRITPLAELINYMFPIVYSEAYFRRTDAEICTAADGESQVETVFFGGGTPSPMPENISAQCWRRAVQRHFPRAGRGVSPGSQSPQTLHGKAERLA